MEALRTEVRTWPRLLAAFAGAMVVLAVVSAFGYAIDDRVLVGALIWAKPLKFSLSFALYAVTLGWLVARLHDSRVSRIARRASAVFVAASTLEMAAIVLQVVRGRQSHFNFSTGFDAAVFAAMGAMVSVIMLALVVIAVCLIVQGPLADRAATWAIRLGLGISLTGLCVGFLMLLPTRAQTLAGTSGGLRGAHSVGVADGGPSIPLLGWSTTGGDLRIAHFVGMHAIQALPLLALALTLIPAAAGLSARTRERVVFFAGFGYVGVFALTLWQALRGQALTAPDGLTLTALAALVLAVATGGAAIVLTARRDDERPDRRAHREATGVPA